MSDTDEDTATHLLSELAIIHAVRKRIAAQQDRIDQVLVSRTHRQSRHPATLPPNSSHEVSTADRVQEGSAHPTCVPETAYRPTTYQPTLTLSSRSFG